MKGWFITGTDTGVGKTHVAAALCAGIRAAGLAAVPVKPVQTGADPGEAPDLAIMLAAAGLDGTASRIAALSPYRFALPAAPHLAAREAGASLSADQLLRAVRSAATPSSLLVVEGAGGVRVPLNDAEDLLDVMTRLALPVVIAARPGLGTLNHTRLTLDAVRSAGLAVAAVVLTPWPDTPSLIEADNRNRISAWASPSPCLTLPWCTSPEAFAPHGACLYEALS